MKFSLLRLFLFAFLSVCLASADEVTFSLSTTGSFSAGTPADLTFEGIGGLPPGGPPGFTGTTSGGFLALDDLGTFTLLKPDRGADTYQNDTFTLDVLFFIPTGINETTSYAASLFGTVNTQQGDLSIDFGPAQHFTFSNVGGPSGSFDLTVNDVFMAIPHNGTNQVSSVLTGSISNAVDPPGAIDSPEPLSIILLGTTLVFSASMVRRRQKRES